ncbi:hypothetical protein BaRGS_00007603, partial [Batillaria attramentaria]
MSAAIIHLNLPGALEVLLRGNHLIVMSRERMRRKRPFRLREAFVHAIWGD